MKGSHALGKQIEVISLPKQGQSVELGLNQPLARCQSVLLKVRKGSQLNATEFTKVHNFILFHLYPLRF